MGSLIHYGTKTWKHWREISLIYVVQLTLGLIVALSFYSEMFGYLQESMVLDHLAKGFDRTVFMDLIYSNDKILPSSKKVGIGILILYLFVGVFLQAGWLANIRNRQYRISSLHSNGLKYVAPFLGLAILSILLVIGVGLLGGIIFTKMVGNPLETFSSEKPYVFWIVFLLILLVFWSIFVWAWSVASRYRYISGDSFFAALKKGFRSVKSNWWKFQAIGLLIVGIHVLFMFLYYWIMGDRGAPSWSVVVIGIFFQQLFNFLRIILRGFGFVLIEGLV